MLSRTCIAVLGNPGALDIFHDDIRAAVFGGTAIQEPGDIGMLEMRQRLPLATEAMQDKVGVHAGMDQLHGDIGLILIVVAFC